MYYLLYIQLNNDKTAFCKFSCKIDRAWEFIQSHKSYNLEGTRPFCDELGSNVINDIYVCITNFEAIRNCILAWDSWVCICRLGHIKNSCFQSPCASLLNSKEKVHFYFAKFVAFHTL